MAGKVKSLSLTKLKISEAEHDGKQERRVTFVASTANEDRDYEIVQIDTFRLPLKGGGHIRVSDLPAGGASNVDIPLLTNHDLWDVSKAIGSVRNAYFEDGKLIFEAGISSRDYAQDIFKLIEEGHLDNAFSIQYRDYHRGDGAVDMDGEIVEVSVVTRGSNKDAQVLEVKSLNKGEEMTTENVEENKTDETTQVETTEETQTNTETDIEDQNQDENEKQEDAEAEDNTTTESDPEENKPTEGVEKQMTTETNHKEIAAAQVKMPSQTATSTNSNAEGYLKSKQADHDFAKTIVENYGKSSQMVMKAWADKVHAKGITGDAILPTSIEQIFFKAWEDHYEMLGTFRRTTKLSGAVYAFNTADTALGHRKGDKKAEQTLNDVRRDYKFKVMYKKLAIDLQDLIDDETGELLRFRTEELSTRMGDELVKAIVFGDGRTAPTGNNPDYRIFDGTRGPWSMVSDLNEAAKTSGADAYSAAVASVIANSTTDSLWQKIVKVKGAIRGGIGRKIIVVPEGTLTELEVATKDNGEPLFPLGTDMQNLFGSYIFESPYMANSGYDVIGYRENSYLLAMGEIMTRTMFDLSYNTDVMLQERAVAGTAYGHKVLAGYASKA